MRPNTKRWIKRGLIGSVAGLVLAGGAVVYLLKRPPAVWVQAQRLTEQTTPQERAQLAEAVRLRLSKMASGDANNTLSIDARLLGGGTGQPSDRYYDQTHELKLTNDELVAVVSESFDEWTAQRGYEVPEQLMRPIVLANQGRLAIAFEVVTPSWSQIFSGHVDLTFKPDGMAIGRVDELTAGSLPVSVLAVGEMLRKQLPANEYKLADTIGEWLSQLKGFEFRPVFELEERRRARVVAMHVGVDDVTLTMRVQDHLTYKRHNALMQSGAVAVTDRLPAAVPSDTGFADVPTETQ